MAYLTPTSVSYSKCPRRNLQYRTKILLQGLGCRSGSYLVYGTLSSVAWIFLVLSMLFSHSSMLRHQHAYFLYQNSDNQNSTDTTHTRNRPLSHTLCNASAVITRILGKIIAIVNALWLISFSIFEYVGLYENCWCYANTISARDKGWVLMFKKGPDLAPYAVESWVGSIISHSFSNTLTGMKTIAS